MLQAEVYFPVIMTFQFTPIALAAALAAAFPVSSAIAAANPVPEAAAVVVTAARQAQAPADVLADINVISAEDIANSGAVSVADLLQQQRGIEIARNGGAGSNTSVFIRGSNSVQNVVLVDGVRVGSSTTGGASWATLPLDQIDHIEIVYGPLSSMYGADAVGGVIQIFTKKQKGAVRSVVSAGIGSYGTRELNGGVSGSVNKELSFSMKAAHQEAEGFSVTRPGAGPYSYNADKDGYKLDSFSASANYEFSKQAEVGAQFMTSRLNAQFDSGPSYDDRNVQNQEMISVFGKMRVNDIWNTHLQLSQSRDQTYTDASYGKSQIDTRQDFITLQNQFQFGKDSAQLIAERREENVITTTKAINGKRRTDSLAGSYLWKQDAHLASAAVRYDRSSVYGNNTTGNLAYGYRFAEGLRLNASLGTSFRAPTFNELYYPGYGIATNRPEKSKNAEIGAVYQRGDLELSAVYFRNRATDLLVTAKVCPVDPVTNKYGCAYNVNQATIAGLTLSGATKFGQLGIKASADFQDPKDDTTGLQLARRAKRHGTLSADWTEGNWKAGVETVFSGRRYDDVANKNALGGYSLLNLYTSVQLNKDTRVLARWNNALNKDYETAKNYNVTGSSLFIGVQYGY